MTKDEYFQALHKLHEPLRKQQIRTNAIGEKYGSHSREYKAEVQKEANLVLALSSPEHKIWAEFTVWLLIQGINAGTRTKEQALKDIYDLAHDEPEHRKQPWREAYKQIKNLP